MTKIHYRGRFMSHAFEQESKGRMHYETECGYWLDNIPKNKNRLTVKKEDVTCVLCLNKLKKPF